MKTRFYFIFGKEGHRQRESFNNSYEFTNYSGTKITVFNSNVTKTNLFTLIKITAESKEDCEKVLNGQISDGIFENSEVGFVGETKENVFLSYCNKSKLYKDELDDIYTESELEQEYKNNIKSGVLNVEEYPNFYDWLDSCINHACTLERYKGV